MQDSLVGRGNVAATRMTRNSASMQNLQAAGHAAALADGLVGIEGARSSGRLGAATRSSASHGGSRGMKNETGVGGGGRLGTGDTSSTAAVAAAAATASGSADTMLGVMLGGGGGGGGSGGSVQKKQKPPGLRRGKWTTEEEKYANRLIHEFKAGLLPLTDGTTLRTFLSIMLNCDPMRISKKFVGSNCIGKQVFRRHHNADSDPGVSEEAMGKSWMELADLERNFLERVAETTSKLKHGGAGAAAAASGYGRSPLFGHAAAAAAAPPPTTRTSGAAASSEQMGLRSNSGSWRRGVDDNESDVKPSVNGAGGKQAFGEEQSGQNCRSSTTNSTPAAPTTLANPPTTTRQRKLRSRPQLQQPAPPQQQQDARRERTSQNSVNSKAPRKKGGKSSGAETNPEGENDERTVRGVVEPGDGVSPNARTSSAASNTSPATGRPSGVDGSRKRGICPGASPGGRGRKPKISARRVKGEGVGKGKEDLAGGERRAEAGGGGGAKVATASAPQQRRQKQLEEKREEQEKEQQQLHEEQRLLQQQQESLQMQQQVLLQQHYHQQQAFMQQQIQQQQQQQPAIGNPAFGFDSDGGPVPRVQSLNTLPSNPPISGSVSVQNLAMLLGMGGASGGGVEACGGNSSSSGVGGGGDGTSGVVSNNFQAAADLAGVAGAMRSTPSSMFLRNNFGQMADIQVENMNLLHLQPQQQQPQLTIPLHGPTNISGGTDGGPGGIGVAMPGGGNIVGGMNTMQMVVPHLFGVRRTSAEDFLSLLQDSEELQAREAQQVREESEERSQSPLTAGQGPPRLSSPLPSGPGLAPLSASVEHVPQGGQIGKPSAAGRGTAEGDDNDLSPPLADASTGGGCSIGVGVDGIGGGNCTRAGERMDGRGKAELTAFVNGGCVGGGGGMEARGAGRGIILGIVPGSGTVPGTREIVEDDQGSEDMYLVGETAEREEDEDEQERDGTGDIAGVLSNGLRAGGGTGHLELKMGLDQESC